MTATMLQLATAVRRHSTATLHSHCTARNSTKTLHDKEKGINAQQKYK